MASLAIPSIALSTTERAKSDNNVKIKLSLNAYTFNNELRAGELNLFDLVDYCVEHDISALDPTGYYFPGYPEVPSDEYIYRLKKYAFENAIEISGTGVRNDFTSPDKKAREKDVELVKNWIVVASKMGAPLIRVFAGRSVPDGFDKSDVMEWIAEDLHTCAQFGKRHGVMIALQNHNEFLETSDEIIRLIENTNSDWLGLHLDIGSLARKDAYDEIRNLIKYAITWQVKENIRKRKQQIPTDFDKLFEIINSHGYRGYFPLETLGGNGMQKLPVLLARVRKAMQSVD